MERFADFLKKLASIKEGDGSILDHSLFLYGSNMSNSNQHDNYPLPEVLVGGANGAHVGGKNRHAAGTHSACESAPDDPGQARDQAEELWQQHRPYHRCLRRDMMTTDRRSFLQSALGGLAGAGVHAAAGELCRAASNFQRTVGCRQDSAYRAKSLPNGSSSSAGRPATWLPCQPATASCSSTAALRDEQGRSREPRRCARAHPLQHPLSRRADRWQCAVRGIGAPAFTPMSSRANGWRRTTTCLPRTGG